MNPTYTADDEALETLSDDVGSLWCRPITVLKQCPDATTFLRNFVCKSVPCIIQNATDNEHSTSPGAVGLSLDDIIERVGIDAMLTVDITPDGHGDCARDCIYIADDDKSNKTESVFVKPHEQQMTIAEFRRLLRMGDEIDKCNEKGEELEAFPICKSIAEDSHKVTTTRRASPVVYYSKQSDCLRNEMKALFSTNIFPESFDFAEEAFGTGQPDAVNLWIGNERSVSSMHKDFYENLFLVCSGQKEFVLCPPADHLFLHEREFQSATFSPVGEQMDEWIVTVDRDENGNELTTKWIEPDVTHYSDYKKYPLLDKSHPMKVLVAEGEMIYIPSLWYHRVTQTSETVGVNYWYDMNFDTPQWCYYNFLQHLSLSQRKK